MTDFSRRGLIARGAAVGERPFGQLRRECVLARLLEQFRQGEQLFGPPARHVRHRPGESDRVGNPSLRQQQFQQRLILGPRGAGGGARAEQGHVEAVVGPGAGRGLGVELQRRAQRRRATDAGSLSDRK